MIPCEGFRTLHVERNCLAACSRLAVEHGGEAGLWWRPHAGCCVIRANIDAPRRTEYREFRRA